MHSRRSTAPVSLRSNGSAWSCARWPAPVDRPAELRSDPRGRAADLNQAFADPTIAAIIATIGGDDSARILPYLDAGLIAANPKVFMGYSDTVTQLMYVHQLGMVTFHGPSVMAGFAQSSSFPAFDDHVRSILFEPVESYDYRPYPQWVGSYADWNTSADPTAVGELRPHEGWRWLNGERVVRGQLVGGCIEVLEFLKGSRYWPAEGWWNDRILFVETSEDVPSIDQVRYWLFNYGVQGVFDRLSGLVVGRPRGYTADRVRETRRDDPLRGGRRVRRRRSRDRDRDGRRAHPTRSGSCRSASPPSSIRSSGPSGCWNLRSSDVPCRPPSTGADRSTARSGPRGQGRTVRRGGADGGGTCRGRAPSAVRTRTGGTAPRRGRSHGRHRRRRRSCTAGRRPRGRPRSPSGPPAVAVGSFSAHPKYSSAVARSRPRCGESSLSRTSQAPWIDAAAFIRPGWALAMASVSPPLMQKPTAPKRAVSAAGSASAWASMAAASARMPVGVTVPIRSRRACMSSSLAPNSRYGPPR